MDDTIYRQAVINFVGSMEMCDEISAEAYKKLTNYLEDLPSAQPEVIPHRNYKYLSDYWCECGWHLGKRGDVKYCPDCGRKVNWDG